jgi:hypothetical protein
MSVYIVVSIFDSIVLRLLSWVIIFMGLNPNINQGYQCHGPWQAYPCHRPIAIINEGEDDEKRDLGWQQEISSSVAEASLKVLAFLHTAMSPLFNMNSSWMNSLS